MVWLKGCRPRSNTVASATQRSIQKVLLPMKFANLALSCLLVFACQASARADYGDLGLAYLFGYGGIGNTSSMRAYAPAPPYFALHPPVYYGQRYTRPYGASPFAAWPQLQANAAYAPQPHVQRAHTIANPYCPPGAEAAPLSVSHSVVVQPLVIENPFYQPDVRYTSAGE